MPDRRGLAPLLVMAVYFGWLILLVIIVLLLALFHVI